MKPTQRPSVSLVTETGCSYECAVLMKSAVFGTSSSLSPLVSEGGGLVCETVGKADLMSEYFDSKQSRELLICRSLAIRLLVLPPLPSGRERSGVSC